MTGKAEISSSYTEFRFGWPVVFASAIGIGLGMSPLPFYTIGVFVAPLMGEFTWRVDQIMLALPIFTFGALFMSPVIGFITDKVGVRRVVLTSIVLFSLTMMAFSLNTGSLPLYLFLWCSLAVTGAGTLPITWTRTVNGWFFQKRGLALGLTLVGTGIFGALAKLYAAWLIELVGWRWAYVGVGALPLFIAFPIAWLMFREPTDPVVAERFQSLRTKVPLPAAQTLGGLTLAAAVKDWRFWLLAYAFIPISFAVGGPIPNLESMMGTKGFSTEDAVLLASIIGYAVVVGRVLGGFLLDHFWAPLIAAILLSIPAAASLALSQPELSFLMAAVAIFVLGLAAGVEYDFMAYLVSRYFGLRNYSAIYGALYGFFALGAGFGPWIYGRFFITTGSYDSVLQLSALAFLLGALPLLLLGRYRDFPDVKK